MQKRPRIDYDSVTKSKNILGIWYESRTIFRIGEFVAKVLNSSKLLSRIPDRPTNCKNSLRTVRINLRPSRTEYDSATNPNICQFVSIRGIRGLCGIGVYDNMAAYKFHYSNLKKSCLQKLRYMHVAHNVKDLSSTTHCR